MIRCVCFDFDGTLVDSNRIKHDTFYEVVADIENGPDVLTRVLHEKPGDRYAIFQRFVDIALQNVEHSLKQNIDAKRAAWAQFLVDDYARRCEEAIAVCAEIPGASDAVAALKHAGIMVVVNSATPTEPLRAAVARRGWHNVFTHVLGGHDRKVDNLMWVADENQLKPQEMVMVGDQETDRQGAAMFGCHFVGVLRPGSEFAEPPEIVIDRLSVLPEILSRFET